MTDAKENLPAVVEAGKFFAKLAGAGEEHERAAGEKFTITINIGDQKLQMGAQRNAPIDVSPPLEVTHVPTKDSSV